MRWFHCWAQLQAVQDKYLSKEVQIVPGLPGTDVFDVKCWERTCITIPGGSRYSTEHFFFSCRTQKTHWQWVLPLWLIPKSQPASWASWHWHISLASWALSRISVQYKWIWWADLRLFHVALVLDHYRLLLWVLWFLAAATGFLTLASALFLPLRLSNRLHRQSNPIHSW